jgi:hypothetical protein
VWVGAQGLRQTVNVCTTLGRNVCRLPGCTYQSMPLTCCCCLLRMKAIALLTQVLPLLAGGGGAGLQARGIVRHIQA